MNSAATLQAIQEFPLEERIQLVFQVWDQLLDGGWQPPLDEGTKIELSRRLAAYRANPANVLTWEQVVANARQS